MVCAPVRRDNPRALARGLSLRTGAQTMLYLTCTKIPSVDLAHYGISRANNRVSVDCGTKIFYSILIQHHYLLIIVTSLNLYATERSTTYSKELIPSDVPHH